LKQFIKELGPHNKLTGFESTVGERDFLITATVSHWLWAYLVSIALDIVRDEVSGASLNPEMYAYFIK